MSLADLSDEVLDGAFAASYDAKDFSAADYYGAEIRDRLTSFWSFATGAISGAQRFPKFEARLNFSQSEAAKSSVAVAAKSVATAAEDAIKTGGMTFALAVLAGIAIYAAIR